MTILIQMTRRIRISYQYQYFTDPLSKDTRKENRQLWSPIDLHSLYGASYVSIV